MYQNGLESNWLALSARRSQLWIKSSRYTTVCYPVYSPHISSERFGFPHSTAVHNDLPRETARNHGILRCSYSNSPVSGSNFKMKSSFFCRPTEREIPCWDHRETIILWRRPGSRELSLLFTTPKLETENRRFNINRNPCLCSNNVNNAKIHLRFDSFIVDRFPSADSNHTHAVISTQYVSKCKFARTGYRTVYLHW